MTRPATLARAALLAAVLAAPAAALADRPTEEVAFYYNKIAFQYATTKDASTVDGLAATPMFTPIDPMPGAGQPAGRDVVMKGSNVGLNAAPSSKPKEIVVVGSKPPASHASPRAHPDFAWVPTARPSASDLAQKLPLQLSEANSVHRPTAPPPAVKAPSSQPQPYTLIELLPIKGSRR